MKIGWIRELFSFSKKERSGIIVLLSVIFILIVLWKLIPYFVPNDTTDYSKWEAEVNAYLSQKKEVPATKPLHLVAFNPNKVDSAVLINMGISSKIAATWVKYIQKGGKFRENSDVRKIFGMTSELFEQLDSFMIIPPTEAISSKEGNQIHVVDSKTITESPIFNRAKILINEKKPVNVLELNNADSLHLLAIPGIGPVFASRIIRYRNLLGGYYSVNQLKEVYGMKEEYFKATSPYLRADQTTLTTFNINFATIQELGRHPYIGFKTARLIFKLRDRVGKFTKPDDLSSLLSGDSLKRMIPYLKFGQ